MLVEGTCRGCGRGFTAPAPRRGPPRQTCSRSCAARGPRRRAPLAERFWRQVQRTDTCWLWTGLHKPTGAGVLTIRDAGRARQLSVARVSWELHVGPIPPGRRLWRRCRRPACVRPDHLVLVRRGSTSAAPATDPPCAVLPGAAAMDEPPSQRLQLAPRRHQWTRARVLAGLRSFWQATGWAPTTSLAWARLTGRSTPARPAHRYPSAYAVLSYFPSFRAAWAAAGIPLTHARWAPWTAAEERVLVAMLGVRPTAEIASTLGRGEAAIYSRARRLGLHVGDAHGWPIHRVAQAAGVSEWILRGYIDRGELPVFQGAKHVYVDIADLLIVQEIDWQQPPAALEAAALHSLRWRLVQLLAGQDWRCGRPQHSRPTPATARGGRHRGVPRASRPTTIRAGSWVHVSGSVPAAPWCQGRDGQVVRVFWSTNPRLVTPEWRALVRFPKQRRRRLGAAISYGLPLAALEPVASAVCGDALAAATQ